MLSVIFVVVALLLVLLNGFFVAAEFSLVKIRPTRLKAFAKSHGWRGRMLLKVHKELDAYLSGCQLGITLASLGLGWIGEPAFARLIELPLASLGILQREVVEGIAFAFAFFLISFLHIVVGELAPKSLAIRQSEKMGLLTAPMLYGFYWLMFPAIWTLNHSSNLVLRWLSLDGASKHDTQYSAEELKLILRSSRADSDFTADEWRVLALALDFRDLEVGDLMRPFKEAVTLSVQASVEANLERIVQNQYSRFPLLDADGHAVGIVHIKDLFFAHQRNTPMQSLLPLARPILVVSPSMSATELFRRFQQGAPHFAVVAFDGERPIGFVTLDNLLEALVGGIRDEFRQASNDWIRLDDGSLMGKASLPLFALERALGIDIKHDQTNSVGGLVLERLGALPHEGQRIEFEQFSIVVKKMDGPRIVLVRIYPGLGWTDYGL
ncbi:MAG: HlyC/CorC family transporter [Burkholderiaceae bacterium]|nr:HlyC/CorC family transporter [Burkholderiaceae bacterium]